MEQHFWRKVVTLEIPDSRNILSNIIIQYISDVAAKRTLYSVQNFINFMHKCTTIKSAYYYTLSNQKSASRN